MSIITTFQKCIKEIKKIEKDLMQQLSESDSQILSNLSHNLQRVIQGKESDWHVSYMDLLNTKLSCVNAVNSVIVKVTMKELEQFCESQIQKRKKILDSLLNLVYLKKLVKDFSYLNLERFDAEVFEMMEWLFDAELKETDKFDVIVKKLLDSKIFSNLQLQKWIASKIQYIDNLHQELRLAQEQIPIQQHDHKDKNRDHQKERTLRQLKNKRHSDNLMSQLSLQEKPPIIFRTTTSALNVTSNVPISNAENNAKNQITSNDQIQQRNTYPLISSKKKNAPFSYVSDQPKESGSCKNSGEWGVNTIETKISHLNVRDDCSKKMRQPKKT